MITQRTYMPTGPTIKKFGQNFIYLASVNFHFTQRILMAFFCSLVSVPCQTHILEILESCQQSTVTLEIVSLLGERS